MPVQKYANTNFIRQKIQLWTCHQLTIGSTFWLVFSLLKKSIAALELIQQWMKYLGTSWLFYGSLFSELCCAFCIHGHDELMEYVETFHPRSIRIYPSKKKQPIPWIDKGKFYMFLAQLPLHVTTEPAMPRGLRQLAGSVGSFWGFWGDTSFWENGSVTESVTDLPQMDQIWSNYIYFTTWNSPWSSLVLQPVILNHNL